MGREKVGVVILLGFSWLFCFILYGFAWIRRAGFWVCVGRLDVERTVLYEPRCSRI